MDWNSVIPAAAVVIGAAIGVFGTKLFVDCREEKAIRGAIAAELRALLDLVDRRKYIEGIVEFTESLKGCEGDAVLHEPLSALVGRDYQIVFASVSDRIGLLPAELASEVVTVHYYIQAFLEDLAISSTAKTEPASAWIIRDYKTLREFYEELRDLAIDTRERIRCLVNKLEEPNKW